MQVTVDQELRPENRTRQEKQESIYILTLPGGGPKQSFGPRGEGDYNIVDEAILS